MKQKLLFVAFLSALVFVASARRSAEGTPDPEQNTGGAGAAGFTVHIDPQTRDFTDGPVFTDSAPFSDEINDAFNLSSEGLVERESDVEGGGTFVELQGRFRSTTVVGINPDGTLSAPCVSAGPGHIAEHLHRERGAKEVDHE